MLLSPVHILIPYYSKHASKEATNQLTYSMGQSSSSETNVHSASEKKKIFYEHEGSISCSHPHILALLNIQGVIKKFQDLVSDNYNLLLMAKKFNNFQNTLLVS